SLQRDQERVFDLGEVAESRARGAEPVRRSNAHTELRYQRHCLCRAPRPGGISKSRLPRKSISNFEEHTYRRLMRWTKKSLKRNTRRPIGRSQPLTLRP